MFNWLNKRYNITDLEINNIFADRRVLRSSLQIAIIDDEGFPMSKKNSLEKKGFIIKTYKDIEDPSFLSEFPIVISDINGVATSLDPEKQGLALVEQISKLYPFKGIGVYSGSTQRLPQLPKNILVINKDDDTDTWEAKIDELINRIALPENIWIHIATRLIEKRIPSEVLPNLEHQFVKKILKHEKFDGFNVPSNNYGPTVSGVLEGLISNGLFFALSRILLSPAL